MDDFELMRQIAAHDQQAVRLLYQQYGKAIYSLAYHILRNHAQADEVTQDTLLKVWQHKSSWDPAKGSLKSWLLKIAHHTAVDLLRHEHRQPNLHQDNLDDIEDSLVVDAGSLADNPWQDEIALKMLLRQLPKEYAALIELAFFQDMSHSDIAKSTQLPLGTIKTRLRSGLQQLRQIWEEHIKGTL